MTNETQITSSRRADDNESVAFDHRDAPGRPPSACESGLRLAWRIVQVRARLIALLAVAFLVVGQWHVLRTYWDKLTAPNVENRSQSVAQGIEYVCPMDPGVVSDWPSKCPVCNMTLVQRKVGDMPVLPAGVVTRMQFSPYRVQLAGVRTSPVSYQPLTYDIHCAGPLTPHAEHFERVLAPCGGVLESTTASTFESTANTIPTIDTRQGEALAVLYTALSAAQAEKHLISAFGEDESRRRFELRGGQPDGARIVLLAPSTGEVLQWHASPGDRLERSMPICTHADLTRLMLNAPVADRDRPLLSQGQRVEISCGALPSGEVLDGHIQRFASKESASGWTSQVCIEVVNPDRKLRPGMFVSARIRVPVSAVEPFVSQPSDAPPIKSGEPRSVLVCPEHHDVIATEPGNCPRDNLPLVEHDLSENQRARWWCPMHPDVQADEPGNTCSQCQGMKLLPRIVTYRPAGQVLAIPETAVVDMGTHKLAYVQRAPGTFDAVEVLIGPRSGDFFPVAKGLELGDRVVEAGAFLIDAEARLNRNLAATYFGASGGAIEGRAGDGRDTTGSNRAGSDTTGSDTVRSEEHRRKEREITLALDELPAADRSATLAQHICPVTGLRLGSMGKPEKLSVAGQVVFVCCAGCEAALRQHPQEYLAKIRKRNESDGVP